MPKTFHFGPSIMTTMTMVAAIDPEPSPELEAYCAKVAAALSSKLDDMVLDAMRGGRADPPPHDGPTLEARKTETPKGPLYTIIAP